MGTFGRRKLLAGLGPTLLLGGCAPRAISVAPSGRPLSAGAAAARANPAGPSFASAWLDVALEATARDVERSGPRPTILARSLALSLTAMYDAWAAYDQVALGTRFQARLRRPPAERTDAHRRAAMSHAMCDVLCDVYPEDAAYVRERLVAFGYDARDRSADPTTPQGIGHLVAREIIASHRDDGANQLGLDPKGAHEPYADTTGYVPANPPDRIVDADRWQPIRFEDGRGGFVTPGFLTPHWGRVRPFALARGDALRPPPPPRVGSATLSAEVAEVLAINADLDCGRKALVEFMRDGPRSTGQAGHWLSLAQLISRRDGNDLDADVRLFFLVANVAHDAFVVAWDAKRAYDSSRPWTLIHHLYAGKEIRGWGGPDRGPVTMKGEEWRPYSPSTFITPPFPGYVSGHSCVSAACAEALRLFTGSDRCGLVETRPCGVLTETAGHMHSIPLETFTAAAELAGVSRIYGGYHTRSDNVEGLQLGRRVMRETWPAYRRYFGQAV